MKRSEQINEIATALSKAQGSIEGAAKDSVNPHFKSRYADLASVWEACRLALSLNGLSIAQTLAFRDGMVEITTLLAHNSGQWFEGTLALLPRDQTPQSVGSAVTYGRRYSVMSMVGIAPEDDDGNSASLPPQQNRVTYQERGTTLNAQRGPTL